MDQMAKRGGLALAVSRQQGVPGFRHIFVSRIRFDEGFVSNKSREKTVCFPLYVYARADGLLDSARTPNVDAGYVRDLEVVVGQHNGSRQRMSRTISMAFATALNTADVMRRC